ncbi:HAD family phosphatase [Listeria sp. PSOL-1]|uniref:HAD family hydrolase n=1 Tax=Listeria sp. PSOL-1 TaxID=1844999 RepID=UPI0013D21F2C|nr:HAD family hydrolase [Listeria sp. PSOL-1]
MKAIVFDFDGTMIDTENLWHQITMDYIKEAYGIDLPNEVYESIIGTSEEPLHDYMQTETNGKFDSAAFTRHVSNEIHSMRDELVLREGVMRIFDYATQRRFKIGLATSSTREWVMPVLKRFGLLERFDTIQTADDVIEIKPDPALYLQAANELGVKPTDAYAIEDSLNGAKAALKAGYHVIVVPNEATKNIHFPDEVTSFDQFDDIELEKTFQ